jgi:hypothetical protein
MGVKTGSCKVPAGKPERRKSPERPRRRWKNNIKMELREAG